jgi:hypothetical protein
VERWRSEPPDAPVVPRFVHIELGLCPRKVAVPLPRVQHPPDAILITQDGGLGVAPKVTAAPQADIAPRRAITRCTEDHRRPAARTADRRAHRGVLELRGGDKPTAAEGLAGVDENRIALALLPPVVRITG